MTSWIESLAEIVQAKYSLNTPLLLSNVRGELASVGINLTDILLGRRLKAAIEAESNGMLKVIKNPKIPLQWFVVPGVAPSVQVVKMINQSETPTSQIPRFQSWFWAAFVKALPPNERRFIVSGRFVETDEMNTSAVVPGHEVLETDIVSAPNGEPVDKQLVYSSLQNWLTRHSLDARDYFEPDAAVDGRLQSRASRVLDISRLSDSDLKRINLPLDLVLKIFG